MENKIVNSEYRTDYPDYTDHVAIMISTDRLIFNERSAVRARMIEYSKLYRELHIIIFSKKSQRFNEVENLTENCKVYATNSYFRFNYIKNAVKIGAKILDELPKGQKILISCQDPFETGLAGKQLSSMYLDTELLIQIHTDLFSPYFAKFSILNKIRLIIAKNILRQAHLIRVVSRKIADSLVERNIDPKEIIIKPIHVNLDYIEEKKKEIGIRENFRKQFPQFKNIVLMISRLEPEKNIEMAISAFADVLKTKDECGLVIVGSGSQMSKLKKIVVDLKIDKNVVFVGWQSDTVQYYLGSDIFLHTSWYEGYGMVLREAQIAGMKIVSTDVGIARDVNATIVDFSVSSIRDGIIKNLK